ncbi:hypothetical protein GRH50_07380 [Campylobacter lari]|nr:hypothetical protein [Campylobacter lari]EDP6895646.1 hypothetical protein [Campylobacter lari]
MYKAGKITDCYIEISKKDLEKLDLFLKLNSLPVNIIFHCENDEQHFIFTEVDYGKDYYDEEKNEIIHKDYLNFKEERK